MVDSNMGQQNPEKDGVMASALNRPRSAWSTPHIEVSRVSDSRANVPNVPTDGTCCGGYAYGS